MQQQIRHWAAWWPGWPGGHSGQGGQGGHGGHGGQGDQGGEGGEGDGGERKVALTTTKQEVLEDENVEGAKTLESIYEFNIGHSIISRSIRTGLEESVQKMRSLLNG